MVTRYNQRDLVGPAQAAAIRNLIQALLVSELIQPSKTLWLASAWVSNIEVIDNTAQQFSALEPDWTARPIRLLETLCAIARRGAEVVVILRDDPHNRPFAERLRSTPEWGRRAIHLLLEPDFHEKGLLGADYSLDGSMNFRPAVGGTVAGDFRVAFRVWRAAHGAGLSGNTVTLSGGSGGHRQ